MSENISVSHNDADDIDIVLLARQDGVKRALKGLMCVLDRVTEIKWQYPDKRLTGLAKTYFNVDVADSILNAFKPGVLDDDPTTLMALGFILLENEDELQRAIGRILLKQGYNQKKISISKDRGRPSSFRKKIEECNNLIKIYRNSDSNSLNSLYQKYADLEYKSLDTIRRRYERFKKENPEDNDMMVVLMTLYRDYIIEVSEDHFFYRVIDDIKQLQELEKELSFEGSSISQDLYDPGILTEAYCEYCVELLADLLSINYKEAREKFISMSHNLSFHDIETFKKMLRYS